MGNDMSERPRRTKHIEVAAAVIAALIAVLGFLGFQNINEIRNVESNRPPSSASPHTTIGPPTTESPETLKKKYIRAADAICRKWMEEIARVTPSSPKLNPEQVAAVSDLGHSQLVEWEALPPPPGDEGKVDEIIQESYRSLAQADRAYRKALDGNLEAAQALIDENDAGEVLNRQRARDYGFRICP